MPSLSTRSGFNPPVMVVQHLLSSSLAAASYGGGYGSITEYSYFDFNAIEFNEIAGATITTRNASDVEVTSGVRGVHGRTDQAINSHTTTQLDKCYVTLPAGEYIFDIDTIQDNGNQSTEVSLFNDTTSEVLVRIVGAEIYINNNFTPKRFSLSAQSNLKIRILLADSVSPSLNNKGSKSGQNANGELTRISSWKFTKIG
jgi:hypothetical protein